MTLTATQATEMVAAIEGIQRRTPDVDDRSQVNRDDGAPVEERCSDWDADHRALAEENRVWRTWP